MVINEYGIDRGQAAFKKTSQALHIIGGINEEKIGFPGKGKGH
jgi:hypothetical protein